MKYEPNYHVKIEAITQDYCILRVYGGPCKLSFSVPKFFVSKDDCDLLQWGKLSFYPEYACSLEASDYCFVNIDIPAHPREYQTLTIQVRNREKPHEEYALSIPYQKDAEAVFSAL